MNADDAVRVLDRLAMSLAARDPSAMRTALAEVRDAMKGTRVVRPVADFLAVYEDMADLFEREDRAGREFPIEREALAARAEATRESAQRYPQKRAS